MAPIPNLLSTCLAPYLKGTGTNLCRYQLLIGRSGFSQPGSANGAKSAFGTKHEGCV